MFKPLKSYEIPEKDFDDILYSFPAKVVIVNDIHNYFYGTFGTDKNKRRVYTDNKDYMVLPEHFLNYIYHKNHGEYLIEGCTSWKQVKVRKLVNTAVALKTYSGSYCYNYLYKLLKKTYSELEINTIMSSFTTAPTKQFHLTHMPEQGKIVAYKNCYKYDINGAYCSELCNIFPKAAEDIKKLYAKKDYYKKKGNLNEANKIKAIFNYFVGMSKRKGFEGFYYTIVNNINEKLFKAWDDTQPQMVIYSNTDSLTVVNPKHPLKTSMKLGEFKLEGIGEMYMYSDKNYYLLEYTTPKGKKEQVGTAAIITRDLVNLKEGLVVHYDKVKDIFGFKIINIKQEKIKKEKI